MFCTVGVQNITGGDGGERTRLAFPTGEHASELTVSKRAALRTHTVQTPYTYGLQGHRWPSLLITLWIAQSVHNDITFFYINVL